MKHDDAELERYASRRGELIANNYVVGEVLGLGGMGVVYSAVQRSLDRVVAIKLPRQELAADPQVRRRLRTEALASSRIDHRNCVRVLDYGSHGGAPYLVMEHVAGPRLGQLLHEHGPFPIEDAIRLVRQVASALEEAHVNGIVHADVKCDNILVETLRDGTLLPRLIDWGIARFSDRVDDSDVDLVTGTPDYLAPEVITGEQPTPAADVYAVGVMLYELITGATPFAESTQVMVSKLEDDVVPIAERFPACEVPDALDDVVMTALARDPASRYADAKQLGHALDSVVTAAPPAARIPVRVRRSSPVFSTEATTATMTAVQPLELSKYKPSRVARRRAAVMAALDKGNVDTLIVAYLELARALVDEHRLDQAIHELEQAIELLAAAPSSVQVWRLLLTLAALYDGKGDRDRARAVARLARERAARDGSNLGRERAERLAARLSQPLWLRRTRLA
jgi:serine/threonine-protein kinase